MRHKNPQDSFNKSSVIHDLDHTGDLHKGHRASPSQPSSLQDTAANDRFIPNFDLEINFEPPDNSASTTPANAIFYRRVVAGLGLLIVIGVFAYYYPASYPDSSIKIEATQVAHKSDQTTAAYKLEQIGNNIILANRWQFTDIDQFTSIWDSLDDVTHRKISKSIWFEQFSFRLERQATDLIRADIVIDPSIALARKLGLIELRASRAARRKAKDAVAYQDSPDEYTDINESLVNNETALNKKITQTNVEQATASANEIVEKANALFITASEVKKVLNQYSKSYIYGDKVAMRALFMDFDDALQRESVRLLMQDYAAVLESSTQRWVEFQDFNWVHNEDISVGTGYITLESTLHNYDRKKIDANLLIKLRRDNSQVKIVGFNLSNQKVALTKFEQPRETIQISSDQPSLGEVQALISRYVKAYEGGDIGALDGLFAKNIISNRGTTRAEINQEYVDLFASSRTRQMNIQDVRWKFSKKRAKGVGTMKAIVEKDSEVNVVKGKIQFVTKKIDGKLLITHLYQLEHSDE